MDSPKDPQAGRPVPTEQTVLRSLRTTRESLADASGPTPVDFRYQMRQLESFVCQATDVVSGFRSLREQLAYNTKCNVVMDVDHIGYRCWDCGISDDSCLCIFCFDPALHEGHHYTLYRSFNSGCCDCGSFAWRRETWCRLHSTPDAPVPIPAGLRARLDVVVPAVVDMIALFTSKPQVAPLVTWLDRLCSIGNAVQEYLASHVNLHGVMLSFLDSDAAVVNAFSVLSLRLLTSDRFREEFTYSMTMLIDAFYARLLEVGDSIHEGVYTSIMNFFEINFCQLYHLKESVEKYVVGMRLGERIQTVLLSFLRRQVKQCPPNMCLTILSPPDITFPTHLMAGDLSRSFNALYPQLMVMSSLRILFFTEFYPEYFYRQRSLVSSFFEILRWYQYVPLFHNIPPLFDYSFHSDTVQSFQLGCSLVNTISQIFKYVHRSFDQDVLESLILENIRQLKLFFDEFPCRPADTWMDSDLSPSIPLLWSLGHLLYFSTRLVDLPLLYAHTIYKTSALFFTVSIGNWSYNGYELAQNLQRYQNQPLFVVSGCWEIYLLQRVALQYAPQAFLRMMTTVYGTNVFYNYHRSNESFVMNSFLSILVNRPIESEPKFSVDAILEVLYQLGALLLWDPPVSGEWGAPAMRMFVATIVGLRKPTCAALQASIPDQMERGGSTQFYDVLTELCETRERGENTVYELKPTSWQYVQPFLPQLTHSDLSALDDAYREHLKEQHLPESVLPLCQISIAREELLKHFLHSPHFQSFLILTLAQLARFTGTQPNYILRYALYLVQLSLQHSVAPQNAVSVAPSEWACDFLPYLPSNSMLSNFNYGLELATGPQSLFQLISSYMRQSEILPYSTLLHSILSYNPTYREPAQLPAPSLISPRNQKRARLSLERMKKRVQSFTTRLSESMDADLASADSLASSASDPNLVQCHICQESSQLYDLANPFVLFYSRPFVPSIGLVRESRDQIEPTLESLLRNPMECGTVSKAFLSCGHLVHLKCCGQISNCPTCRSHFTHRLPLFPPAGEPLPAAREEERKEILQSNGFSLYRTARSFYCVELAHRWPEAIDTSFFFTQTTETVQISEAYLRSLNHLFNLVYHVYREERVVEKQPARAYLLLLHFRSPRSPSEANRVFFQALLEAFLLLLRTPAVFPAYLPSSVVDFCHAPPETTGSFDLEFPETEAEFDQLFFEMSEVYLRFMAFVQCIAQRSPLPDLSSLSSLRAFLDLPAPLAQHPSHESEASISRVYFLFQRCRAPRFFSLAPDLIGYHTSIHEYMQQTMMDKYPSHLCLVCGQKFFADENAWQNTTASRFIHECPVAVLFEKKSNRIVVLVHKQVQATLRMHIHVSSRIYLTENGDEDDYLIGGKNLFLHGKTWSRVLRSVMEGSYLCRSTNWLFTR